MIIAVLMTCFNRKQKTLACLQLLQEQLLPNGVELRVFLTDDASSDGTVAAVRAAFPSVTIFYGSGELYWAGGMRHTWTLAMESDPDYYLLLNDDTMLEPFATHRLLATGNDRTIVIGTTGDPETGRPSYGGWKLTGNGRWKSSQVYHRDKIMEADFANANILLVPRMVVNEIGILADHFTHSLADYDYTLKARKAGFPLLVAPGLLGRCKDDTVKNWKSSNTTLKERIGFLRSVKGLAYKEYLRFIRDHFPKSYITSFTKLWLKTFFPFIWDLRKSKVS